MLDGNEADDKLIAVLQGDGVYGALQEISECPGALLDRLRHYFLTYKQAPEPAARVVEITHVYDRDEAHQLIRRSHADYRAHFPELARRLEPALGEATSGPATRRR